MLLGEFFSEIETSFAPYQETGDIDRVSIKTWVIACLNRFGKNICDQREAIIEVKNSQAVLPETFKSLILALDLTNVGCHTSGNKESIKDSFIYRERIEQEGYFDWVTNEFVTNNKGKLITESIVMNSQSVNFFYKPSYLSVVKGFKKDSFDVDCINLHPSIRNAYTNMININNQTLQANFKNGRVYIQYNSLPTEEGEIIIPEISTGEILLFIENYVRVKIAESLILSNKGGAGLSSLISLWIGKERALFLGAKSEANWSGMGDFSNKYKKKLQIEFNKYTLPRF